MALSFAVALTDGFVKVGGLSLMSESVIVAVPVLERPVLAPFISLICTFTRCLSWV